MRRTLLITFLWLCAVGLLAIVNNVLIAILLITLLILLTLAMFLEYKDLLTKYDTIDKHYTAYMSQQSLSEDWLSEEDDRYDDMYKNVTQL